MAFQSKWTSFTQRRWVKGFVFFHPKVFVRNGIPSKQLHCWGSGSLMGYFLEKLRGCCFFNQGLIRHLFFGKPCVLRLSNQIWFSKVNGQALLKERRINKWFCFLLNYFASSDPHYGIQFIPSDILSVISSDILSGILSDISSDILSGILSGMYSIWHIFWHSVCHIFWHSIWHIFWHSIWKIFWHSIWHIFWHSVCHIFWHSIWKIFWHSIWHIFWHSVCHIFWHSIWKIFWHSIWHIFWHSIWHIFWHSVCHIFWHSIWHIFWHSIWHDLSGIVSGRSSDILSGISSDILSGVSFILSGILSGIFFGILYGFVSGRCGPVKVRRGPRRAESGRLKSGEAHSAQTLAGWSPARPTAIKSSQMRSGNGHWNQELAEEIRRGSLRSRAGRWGPATATEIKSWQRRSGEAHCDQELADEVRRGRKEEGGRTTRRRSRASDIKPNNPHLAGGEKSDLRKKPHNRVPSPSFKGYSFFF